MKNRFSQYIKRLREKIHLRKKYAAGVKQLTEKISENIEFRLTIPRDKKNVPDILRQRIIIDPWCVSTRQVRIKVAGQNDQSIELQVSFTAFGHEKGRRLAKLLTDEFGMQLE